MSEAKKYVYLIFFSGSGRTYHLRFRRLVATFLTLLVSIALIWSVFSAALVLWLAHQNADLFNNLTSTRYRLFSYQALVEQAYEKAYPPTFVDSYDVAQIRDISSDGADRDFTQALVQANREHMQVKDGTSHREMSVALPIWPREAGRATAQNETQTTQSYKFEASSKINYWKNQEPVANPSAWESVSLEDPLVGEAIYPSLDNDSSSTESADNRDTPSVQPPSAAPAVIERVHLNHRTSRSLELEFVIRNNALGRQVRGQVYAIATFIDDNGDKHLFTAPGGKAIPYTELSDEARPRAESFGVRRFRPSNFRFDVADGVTGRFTHLEILVHDHEGVLIDHFAENIQHPSIARGTATATDKREL